MKIKLILNLVAKLMGVEAVSMLPSLAVSIRYGDGDWLAFVQTITLMGVIAPFFGVPLSSIARQSEVKQSFIDFYLPFENSYIVYEYQRDGQQFCVLLRRRGDTPSAQPRSSVREYSPASGSRAASRSLVR